MNNDLELEHWRREWQAEVRPMPSFTRVPEQAQRTVLNDASEAQTAAQFTTARIRYCRRAITVLYCATAVGVSLVLLMAWIFRRDFTETPPFGWTFLIAGPVINVATIVGASLYRRKKQRELRFLLSLQLNEPAYRSEKPSAHVPAMTRFLMQRLAKLRGGLFKLPRP